MRASQQNVVPKIFWTVVVFHHDPGSMMLRRAHVLHAPAFALGVEDALQGGHRSFVDVLATAGHAQAI